ncbi:MAG: efflux RND transporter permease subunit [Puniceicoccaceae bacterium]
MIAWFTRNGVATNLLFAFIILGGIFATNRVKIELFPEFSIETIIITVPYPGAAPEEVESAVCRRIEDRIYDVDGINRLSSTAGESVGVVVAEVASGYDVSKVLERIERRIEAIDSFPVDVERPIVEEVLIRRETIAVAIYGEADPFALKETAKRARDEITRLPGISQAEVVGVPAYEISIEVPEEILREFNLTFEEVAQAVRATSLEVPGGAIRAASGEILVRASSQARDSETLAQIILRALPDGSLLRLGDIATIRDGFVDDPILTQFDGKPAAIIRVYEVGDQNPLRISREVKDYAETVAWLPQGIEIRAWRDLSIYLKDRLTLLLKNGGIGFGLVLIVLALFLRPSLAFFVALGIPLSFLGTVLVMPTLGLTINLVSLFGFILVLGIVVDDAIVVGESVFSEYQKNGPGVDSAIKGAQVVALPVTFAVLTTVVAFTPIFFLTGFVGKLFYAIPAVVIPTLLWSLVGSKLILPYHLSLISVGRRDRSGVSLLQRIQLFFADSLQRFVERIFRPTLQKALELRYLVGAVFVSMMLLTLGLIAGNKVRFTFISPVPSDYIVARLEMPVGTPFDFTSFTAKQLEAALAEVVDQLTSDGSPSPIRHQTLTIGSTLFDGGGPGGAVASTSSPEKAELAIELIDPEERLISAPALANLWRKQVGELPGVKDLSFEALAAGGAGAPIDVRLSGADLEQLQTVSSLLRSQIGTYEGIFDIRDTLAEGKDEIQLSLRPEASHLGLRQIDLANQVRAAFFGLEAQRLQRDEEEIKVMVRYPKESRRYLESLKSLRLRLPDGREVPFEEVADISVGKGYAAINRVNRERSINIRADADKAVADVNQILIELRRDFIPELQSRFPDVSFDLEGEAEEQQETFQSLSSIIPLVILAIYALMAVPFGSYLQPLVVMSVIPFGFVGAIWGHLLTGQDFSLLSILGLVALSGVVVNDSLVMVDYINKRRGRAQNLHTAVREAGAARFRPIILTSATTFVGLTPILLEKSLQAQFLIPMATSLAFGILFATLITLFLVPALYIILEDIKRLIGIDKGESS